MRARLGLVSASAALIALAGHSAAQLVVDSPAPVEAGNLALRVLVGDINEDGLPDILASHWIFGGGPTISFGTAPGQFGAPQGLPFIGAGTSVFRLADFDADGHLDLLSIVGATPFSSLSVVFGNGDGSFGQQVGVNGNFTSPIDADVGDFDADGHLDLVVYNGSSGFSPGAVLAFLGNGDRSFKQPVDITPSPFLFGAAGVVRVGDTNGDGFDDFVLTTGVSMPTILSLGDGRFAQASCTSCVQTTARDFELADLNGDDRADLVTPNGVLLAQPGGTFGAGQSFPSDFAPWTVALGDLDDDGVLDAVIGRNGTGTEFDPGLTLGDVRVMRGAGDGSFETPGVIVSHVPQPRDLAIADLDLDGRPDIVVAEFQSAPSAAARLLRNATYPAGSPFLDVGSALGGTNGYPIQLASGTLVAGQPFAFTVKNGPPSGAAFHIVGLSALNAPFKGGTLVPSLTLINGPFPLSPEGKLTLAGGWPAGGSGLTLWAQFWMPNGGGPSGLVASSGVRAQVP